MKTEKSRIQKYLVLVPHKETHEILRKYTEELLKNGLKGVYPFPFVAPLAELDKPMSPDELKKYAKDLRANMGKEKFTAIGFGTTSFSVGEENLSLQGPELNAVPLCRCVRIIGIFLSKNKISIPPIELSFRAAAVANFYIKQIPNGFKWKIGKLYWLPKVASAAVGSHATKSI